MMKEKNIVNDENEVVSVVVDCRTGDITDTFRYGDSYKKQTRENKNKILEYMSKQENLVELNKGKRFVKLYDDVLEELYEYLSPSEFTFAMRLSHHVSYRDCILRTNGNPNGKILTAKDIAILLKMDDSNVRRLIASLVKKGVLGKHTTGCKDNPTAQIKVITCNPFIYL